MGALMKSMVNSPAARKERFVNNIGTSTHKVSKLNINFRICELCPNTNFSTPDSVILLVLILQLKLCVLNAFVKLFWTVSTINTESYPPNLYEANSYHYCCIYAYILKAKSFAIMLSAQKMQTKRRFLMS